MSTTVLVEDYPDFRKVRSTCVWAESCDHEEAMLRACSHLTIATDDVPRITRFVEKAFELKPKFENTMFSEFVLPSKFRIAFFKPVGASARSFRAAADRDACAVGITVSDVDAVYRTLDGLRDAFPLQLSGPPKEHPWGEKSFLLTDPDGNCWEVTQTPSEDGMLIDR